MTSWINQITWILAAATPATGDTAQTPPVWTQFIPIVALFLIMWVLFIRPQQKKAKEHEALVKAVKVGDKVVTNGGIIGVVTGLRERSVSLRSEDSKFELLKDSISQVLESSKKS